MQKGFTPIYLVMGLGILLVVWLGLKIFNFGNFDGSHGDWFPPLEKACTLEAKICPDGSSVGRSGPNCEFAACPSIVPSASASADLSTWKTFNGKGYTVQYPADYLVYSGERDNFYSTKSIDKKPIKVDDHESNTTELLVIDQKKADRTDACDIKPDSYEATSGGKCLQIAGYQVMEYNTNNYYGPLAFNDAFISKGTEYTLGFLGIPKEKKDQILATFKFN